MTLSKYVKPVDEWVIIDDYINLTGKKIDTVYSMLSRLKRVDINKYQQVRQIKDGRLWVNYGQLDGYYHKLVNNARQMFEYVAYDVNAFHNDHDLARAIHEKIKDKLKIPNIYRYLRYLYADRKFYSTDRFIPFHDGLYEVYQDVKKAHECQKK